jgi:hypothetical protein
MMAIQQDNFDNVKSISLRVLDMIEDFNIKDFLPLFTDQLLELNKEYLETRSELHRLQMDEEALVNSCSHANENQLIIHPDASQNIFTISLV